MNFITYLLKNPEKLSLRNIRRGLILSFARLYPDKLFLKSLFPLLTGYKLNLENPKSFNEKLQWLKLYDRRPEYSIMVDKYEAKKYVAKIIGENHIIPTIGVYDSAEEIDFASLPKAFVLKCTHNSGGVVVCKDKSTLDYKATISKLRKCLKTNYYYQFREWPYKTVKPRIIAEKYMEDNLSHELVDYKFYCFNGVPKIVMVAQGRFSGEKVFAYFDINWNKLHLTWGAPPPKHYPSKPHNYEEMLDIASRLSSGIPHVRVDLYCVNDVVLFGELTFFDGSGMQKINPIEWDYRMGDWIQLPHPSK